MKFKDVKMTARFGKRYGKKKKKEEKIKNVMLAKLGGKKGNHISERAGVRRAYAFLRNLRTTNQPLRVHVHCGMALFDAKGNAE